MDKEINLKALLSDKLISEYMVENCSSFIENPNSKVFSDLVTMRNFNQNFSWSIMKQTGFIESIFMGCELPLIITFNIPGTNSYILADGLNRFLTIQRFLKDELKLCSSGIEKAKFLENKVFSELDEECREYFLNRGIQVLKYSYKTDKELEKEEIEAIIKQLYIRYNSGIKLKSEEIQKADYQDDYITIKMEELLKNKEFFDKLKKIHLTPKKESATYYEKILMYIRLAITFCYAPIDLLSKQPSNAKKIDLFYKDYTCELDKDNIINDFLDNVNCLYEIVNNYFLEEYKNIETQEFLLITFWLLFQLRKNNLIELNKFDWQKYICYFSEKEKETILFSYFRVNMISRFKAVIEYVYNNYNIDLYRYIPKEQEENNKNKVNRFEDLPKYNFQLARDGITISTLLDLLNKEAFILKPRYQRREINDISASSFLIESILLNMNVPDILVYRHIKNGKTIFEVVDGQQRCLSFLALFNRQYKNLYGEEVSSSKEGYALKNLTILTDLNDKKIKSNKNKLSDKTIDKILNGKIRIVYIPEEENPFFSPKDYFTRINKTITPLKKNYRYWVARYDKKLMDSADKIANKYSILLPKMDSKFLPQQYIVNLAYVFYMKEKDFKIFSVQQVTKWLNDFECKKNDLIKENKEDEVKILRKPYKDAFERVDLFLGKILIWLNNLNKTINDLIAAKYNKSFHNLYYIYYLLNDINEIDITNNQENIYNIIHEFFLENLMKSLKKGDIAFKLKRVRDLLSPFYVSTIKQNEFKERINKML